jgi:hypothetical protein
LRIVAEDESFLDDLDFLAFTGRNRDVLDVQASLQEKSADGQDLLLSEYRRQHALVFDIARYIGPIGVRMDLAFQSAKTFTNGSFQSVRAPALSGALGLSYERIEDENDSLLMTVEGTVVRPFLEGTLTDFFVPIAERPQPDETLLFIGDLQIGIAGLLSWMIPTVKLDLQVAGLHLLTSDDTVLMAKLARRFEGWFRPYASWTLFHGGETSTLSIGSLYDHNDAITLGVDGVF